MKKSLSLALALCLLLFCSCEADAPLRSAEAPPAALAPRIEETPALPEESARPEKSAYEGMGGARPLGDAVPHIYAEDAESRGPEPAPSAAEAETGGEAAEPREAADTSGYRPYIIKVNRLANCATVYTYDVYGDYSVPVRAMVCSCGGENTPLGEFSLSDKYSWGCLLGGVWGLYCSRITGGILFHSVPYSEASPDKLLTEEYNKLGSTASHGCVRLTAEDAKWIYDNCQAGTEVVIYEDREPGPLGKPETASLPAGCGWDPTNPDPANPWLTGRLTLEAEGRLQIEVGDRPDFLKGVRAEDACGDDLISEVRWKTNADLKKPGVYTVFYFLRDALGNKAVLKRFLDVYEPGTLSSYDRERAEELVRASAEKHHAMGIAAAVIENGRVADTLVFGDAVYNVRKMTEDTKIRVASISKIGVAMAAAKLYDEGLIDPDEDISVYWGAEIRNPWFPDTPITIRDIMSHTSSLTSDDDDYRLGIGQTLAQLLSGEVFSRCKPGLPSSFMYNNYAFGILADTLELRCGRALDDYIKESIFEPLGIEASYSTATLKKEELAELYDAGWKVTRSVEHMSTRPVRTDLGGYMWYYAGNLTIGAGDLARLATVLINDGEYDGEQLLSAGAVGWLEEPQFETSDEVPLKFTQCQPLRYRSGMYGRESLYYHTGQAYGACTLLCYDPDSGDGAVVLTTGAYPELDDFGVAAVCGDIASAILEMLKN